MEFELEHHMQHPEFSIVKTAEEYFLMVQQMAGLVDGEFCKYEDQLKTAGVTADLIERMPALISLVNVLGYLRGQHGMFLNLRPSTDRQKELYAIEDCFEDRLQRLIDVIMDSNEKSNYTNHLEQYFSRARTVRSPLQ